MIHEAFNQVGVQPQVGLTFATALRHILRQDPDIIMVGEIRDAETAENAIQAALTGHLVLSTLHTNDAPTAITRLADMGIPRYLSARRSCSWSPSGSCGASARTASRSTRPAAEELASLGLPAPGRPVRLRRGRGLRAVPLHRAPRAHGHLRDDAGHARRCGALIRGGADQGAILAAARKEGMRTLRESGVQKVLRGVTTVAEVLRVTMRDPE